MRSPHPARTRFRRWTSDDHGFTLIELLVVIIIIGVLATIAIPTYLKQRRKSWDAAAKSDLKNAATAQETYFTEDNGLGASSIYAPNEAAIETQGFNPSDAVILTISTVDTPGAQSYCMSARHVRAEATRVWYLGSEGGQPSLTPC